MEGAAKKPTDGLQPAEGTEMASGGLAPETEAAPTVGGHRKQREADAMRP